MKLNSIPESEPLYTIIKSRVIDLDKIKDKDERKRWKELAKINALPDIYKSHEELKEKIKKSAKRGIGGI